MLSRKELANLTGYRRAGAFLKGLIFSVQFMRIFISDNFVFLRLKYDLISIIPEKSTRNLIISRCYYLTGLANWNTHTIQSNVLLAFTGGKGR